MAMPWSETQGKQLHDPFFFENKKNKCKYSPGPIIVGAGPSGLAMSACLKEKGIPSMIIERSSCIASLWQLKTYDRLRLHLPKQFCELPLMPFPSHYPTYPTKQQFLEYLYTYTKKFDIRPYFNEAVESAEFDAAIGLWRVRTGRREYVSRWLVVATGENAVTVVPEIEGMEEFVGAKMHVSSYRRGDEYTGKNVLVVGCGNSGMEVCLDLCNHNARPSIVVRDSVHILPQEMLGHSTFGLSMSLLKWLPIRTVDRFILFISWLMLGNTEKLGLRRPEIGPLELKSISGKTPVLDVGTLAKIKLGEIKVYPGIQRITRNSAEFVDGSMESFDAIILATGYKSDVPSWLKEREFFSEKDGFPKKPFPGGWKGEHGLYVVGFTKRGLLGASMDARRIADDIEQRLKSEANQIMFFTISPNI